MCCAQKSRVEEVIEEIFNTAKNVA
jgi:hypothetical protein